MAIRKGLVAVMSAALAVGLGAMAAEAAPVVTWTVDANAATSSCGVSLDVYTFHAKADDGQVIVVVDASPSATNPYGGFYDSAEQYAGVIAGEVETWEFGADGAEPLHPSEVFHQDWWVGGAPFFDDVPTTLESLFGGLPEAGVDTHFVDLGNGTHAVNTSLEDNDKSCGQSGNGANEGWGTYLTGVLGVAASNGVNEQDIVQLVVPSGQAFYAKFQVVQSGPSDNSTTEFAGTVPEPATMVLLGLGGLGMLIRRRRT